MNESTEFGFEMRPARRRGFIVAQAVFYGLISSLLGASVFIALFKVLTGEGGFIVLFFVSLVFGFPFASRAYDFIRDLGGAPDTIEGEVMRKWSKANFLFFFMHGLYMAVEEDPPASGSFLEEPANQPVEFKLKSNIYSVSREDYAGLLEGDRVRILRHRHSLTIEECERYDETTKKFIPVKDEPF